MSNESQETKNVEKKEARKYPRVAGAGVGMSLIIRNRLLGKTFDYVFERTDNQLAILANYSGAGEELKSLKELIQTTNESVNNVLEQLKAISAENNIVPAFTGNGFTKNITVLTPYSAQYVKAFQTIDEAASYLHALWVASLVEDEAWREQVRKMRSRLHDVSRSVDTIYRNIVKTGDANDGKEHEKEHNEHNLEEDA